MASVLYERAARSSNLLGIGSPSSTMPEFPIRKAKWVLTPPSAVGGSTAKWVLLLANKSMRLLNC